MEKTRTLVTLDVSTLADQIQGYIDLIEAEELADRESGGEYRYFTGCARGARAALAMLTDSAEFAQRGGLGHLLPAAIAEFNRIGR